MTDVRRLRRDAALSQRQCAGLLCVPVNPFRMWDSGLRPTPGRVLQQLRLAVDRHADDSELLSLAQLARELHVHQRTLHGAARAGRLEVQLLTRSRVWAADSARDTPCWCRLHGAVLQEMLFAVCVSARRFLTHVPADYDRQLKRLRRSLRMTQSELAKRVGAAGKAVVYQWESRQRQPSVVFLRRVLELCV